jgi:hypothetical protein
LGIFILPFCMMCWLFLNFFMVYTPMYHSVIGGGLQILTPLIFPFFSVSCPRTPVLIFSTRFHFVKASSCSGLTI